MSEAHALPPGFEPDYTLEGPRLYAVLDEALERLAEIEAEKAAVRETARLRVEKIQGHEQTELERIDRHADYWRQRVEHLGPRAEFSGKKKSLRLAFGEIGFRKRAGTVEVLDMARAVEFARGANLPVKVVESVSKTDLAKLCRDGLRPEPAEDGFAWVEGEDEFFWRAGG
jgi:hypothetical protein